ncbi:MAG: zinc ribbon domain-containing protein [Gammaproteobacteria bacterium]
MPVYDYRCEANGQLYEVKHPMSVTVTNWGELKALAEIDDDAIPDSAPVTKVLTTGGVVKSSSLKNPQMPSCPVSGCGGGGCQFQ